MVIAIDAEANETCHSGAFEGVPWACHGTGFCKYWKQMRNSKSSEVMMHHSVGDVSIAGTVYALLTVCVKVQDSQMSQYKLDFFCSLSGQTHAFAAATNFNLLYQGKSKRTKGYACKLVVQEKSTNSCNTCICRQCFDGLSMTTSTTFLLCLEPMKVAKGFQYQMVWMFSHL